MIWLGLSNSREKYALRYESKYMKELGNALEYIAGIGVSAAVKEGLKHTILSGLLAAIVWPATLLSVASFIDNPWSICTQRSSNAGRQLAEVLLSRQQGKRPVTLIGFSFGARVIFSCLTEMAQRKNCEGIVEDVVLLGAPVTGDIEEWQKLSRVVSGRIVNGYCRGDWLLKFMYRTASVQFSIAGLDPVKWNSRLMHNIDLTHIVSGHLDYLNKIDEILDTIGIHVKAHAEPRSGNSLKQWTEIQRGNSKHSLSAQNSMHANYQKSDSGVFSSDQDSESGCLAIHDRKIKSVSIIPSQKSESVSINPDQNFESSLVISKEKAESDLIKNDQNTESILNIVGQKSESVLLIPEQKSKSGLIINDQKSESESIMNDQMSESDSIILDQKSESDLIITEHKSASDSIIPSQMLASDSINPDQKLASDSISPDQKLASDSINPDQNSASDMIILSQVSESGPIIDNSN